eukprot:INCI6147.2.p1 GENE.INCI6147.2~~INCI6147.2.p1  ORF type:complete len:285 (-),score=32.61 INCI6147.2:23-877(-)
MPEFDKYFMPPSVTVEGNSMFDDNIAFALMADNASGYAADIPLAVKLSYGLPYASYHESRVNWRPLFFAKFFQLVTGTMSTQEAMSHLVAPNVFLNWTSNVWESHPAGLQGQTDYNLAWSSSTSPPVINPFSFAAYGYSSCSGWATFVTYMAKALGIPARQVGTPCWNQPLGGVDYRGLARDNPNVTICWHGGIGSPDGTIGGNYLVGFPTSMHTLLFRLFYWFCENSVLRRSVPEQSQLGGVLGQREVYLVCAVTMKLSWPQLCPAFWFLTKNCGNCVCDVVW